MIRHFAFSLALWISPFLAADQPKVPTSVMELWSDFDPTKEPLGTKIVREWEKENLVFRFVTFHIGTFKGKPAQMAGFYAFPRGAQKQPALLHLHGGGQRAFLHAVEFFARRGYPILSINWGGREMEGAQPGDPNTDWGAVDPTQNNVPGYFNLEPGEKYLDPVRSPRNNNWYLLTIGARRSLTFLQEQPEVDPDKLGVYGHSMGGNLTVYTAGSDGRVKVAVPSVGGSGFRTQPWPLLPQQRKQKPNGDVTLFDSTLGFESYAPHIKAPLLWLGATNDFHGIMDDTYRTGMLIPHQHVRYAFTPHMNHRFTSEFEVTRSLWIDQHLRGHFRFPITPVSKLELATEDRVPIFQITPDSSMPIERVQIFYSVDPDPQARFWRTAEATQQENRWSASLPIPSLEHPLFAFANVHYRLDLPQDVPLAPPTQQFAISSLLHTATPAGLANAAIQVTDQPTSIIDDFQHGWQDWYRLSPDNPHHWEYSTRKLTDPKWRGLNRRRLTIDLQADKPNELVIVLTENFFRQYRGKQAEFAAVIKLNGGKSVERHSLDPKDFKTSNGEELTAWTNIDLLSFRAYYEKDQTLIGSKKWVGPQPDFQLLSWQSHD